MLGGFTGKVLWVNLTTGQITAKNLDPDLARKFIGGSGIAAQIVWDETGPNTEPLSPENPLVFMTGPLTATAAPSSGRYVLNSLSPLTGIWGEANSGGKWATELKNAGFDGIVFTGRAESPVYLWVNAGDVKLCDAGHLWGKDTYETTDLVRSETDERASVASIGQAGERMVNIACVIADGRDGRAAARCGLGAVMGYKNLKAVSVKGKARPKVSQPEKLKESVQRNYYSKTFYSKEVAKEVDKRFYDSVVNPGRLPIKNFRQGTFTKFLDGLKEHAEHGQPYFCPGCRTGSMECYMIDKGRRAVYEATGPLGSQCLIDDMEALDEAFDICQRTGIDSISTGGVVSFGMEAFEKGLITREDTGGIDLTWGNAEAMTEMVRQVGMREGFGAVLGEGVRKAAEHIGRNASEFALHVKGLEFPAHDPRSMNLLALSYATVNFGAGHMAGGLYTAVHTATPELGMDRPDDDESRFWTEGRGPLTTRLQNWGSLVNAMGTCAISFMLWLPPGQGIIPSTALEWLNAATGWDMSLEEFLKCGERIFNLQRMINVRRGISRKDDTLPARFLTERLKDGGTRGNLPCLGPWLGEYYSSRGWTDDGIPTPEKLQELGLEYCMSK